MKSDQLCAHAREHVFVCTSMLLQDSASGCNGILLPQTVSSVTVYSMSRLTLRLATTRAECTSNTPFLCGAILWKSFHLLGFQLPASVGVGGVSLCLISLPQSIPLNKINHDDQ